MKTAARSRCIHSTVVIQPTPLQWSSDLRHDQLQTAAALTDNMDPVSLDSSHPISYTARIVAAKRAIEQRHSSPLFHDPYAAALAGDEVQALLARWQAVAQAQALPLEQVIAKRTRYIAVRTRFIDDLLTAALSDALYKQVVILGAGLDSRAYRFPWSPGTTLYEVDSPEVLLYKTQVLQAITPTCTYRPVPGDLARADRAWAKAILQAGYHPTAPTLWLSEGVVMYLQEEQVHYLLQTISQLSVTNSILGMDGVTVGSVLAGRRAQRADRGRVVRHWLFGHDHPEELLASYGWRARVNEPQDLAQGYGRYPKSMPMSTETPDQDNGRGVWLVQAVKD